MKNLWKTKSENDGVSTTLAASNDIEIDRQELVERAESYLRDVLAQETKLPIQSISARRRLEKYGIDSVLIVNLTRRLERTFGELSKTLFFEYQTLAELAEYFADEHRRELVRTLGLTGASPDEVETAAPASAKLAPRPEESAASPAPRARIWGSVPAAGNKESSSRAAREEEEPIAIIGVHGRYPEADNLDELWENLKAARDCIREIPPERWDHSKYFDAVKGRIGRAYAKWGGFLRDVDRFDHLFFDIAKAEADFLDPQERLWLEAVWHTLEDAGYAPSALEGRKVGVYVGVMSNMYQKLDVAIGDAVIAPVASYASIANRTSYQFDWQGPSIALDTMCSSSLTAIHLACESLRHGETELAIAGGVNVIVHPNKYVMLSLNGFMSTDGRCRSFGAGGDGYVPGEGVGAVLLKPLSRARADGDRIHAVIRGTAVNHGGRTNGFTVPNPNAQADLVAQALSRAGVSARSLGYVEAHGTGTSLGDPIEIRGLGKAFSKFTDERQFCPIGSIKSNVGHLESAAGIAGVTKVLLQMKHRTLVPSIHTTRLNPNIEFERSPVFVQRELAPWKAPAEGGARVGAVSAFGAGGSNAHVVIEEWVDDRASADGAGAQPQLVLLSAKSQGRLATLARTLLAWVERDLAAESAGEAGPTLRDIAYTTQVGRAAFGERLAIVARDKRELLQRLRDFASGASAVRDTYRGSVNDAHGVVAALAEGPEGAEIVRMLLATSSVAKLGQLWSLGMNVDFVALHAESRPHRVALPLYPFERTHCWVPGTAAGISAAPPAIAAAPAPAAPPTVAAPLPPPAPGARPDPGFADFLLDVVANVSPHPRDTLRLEQRLFEDLNFDSIMVAALGARVMATYPDIVVTAELYEAGITIAAIAEKLSPQTNGATDDGGTPREHFEVARFPETVAKEQWERALSASGASPLPPFGADVVDFTCCDYLGLATDGRVKDAGARAAAEYGTSGSASRPVSGEMPTHGKLESQLSRFLGTDATFLFLSGHVTSMTTIEALLGAGDLVLFDEASRHTDIVEGALLSGAEAIAFPHNDANALDGMLDAVRSRYKKVVIAVEGVYGRDGDIADLPRFIAVKKKHKAFLLVDEDNSFGVLGASGRGVCEHFGIAPRDVDVITCGINKSLASCGGFAAGNHALIEYLRYRGTNAMFSTAITPVPLGAAQAALDVLEAEPQRAARVRENAADLRARLTARAFALPAAAHGHGAIVPVTIGGAHRCMDLARALRARGVAVDARVAGEMSERAGRLVFTVTALHTPSQIASAVEALAEEILLAETDTGATDAGAAIDAAEEAFAVALAHEEPRIARDLSQLRATRPAYEGDVPARFHTVAEFSEYQLMAARLKGMPPEKFLYYKPHDGVASNTITVRGRRMINYSSYNYLGMSGNPEVVAAVRAAIERWGTGVGAQRRTGAAFEVHKAFERELSSFIGTGDAVLFDSGHNTNVGAIGHLFGPDDLVLHDVLSHNSLVQGMLLSGAKRLPFPHNDYRAADELLRSLRHRHRRVGIIIEGVYSQDGDIADLGAFVELKHRHKALLYVDEAHSFGVLGRTGRGITEHAGIDPSEIDIQMGTLSKSLGASGGFITGSRELIAYMREAPCLRNNGYPSSPLAAAALESLRVMQRHPEKVTMLRDRAEFFLRLAKEEGLDTGLSSGTPVVPIMTHSSALAYQVTYGLLEKGITVHPFTYPVVPENAARVRFFISAEHTEEQLRTTVREVAREVRAFGGAGASTHEAPAAAPATRVVQPAA